MNVLAETLRQLCCCSFPACQSICDRILSNSEGLTKDERSLFIQCLSWFIRHDICERHSNGDNVFYFCPHKCGDIPVATPVDPCSDYLEATTVANTCYCGSGYETCSDGSVASPSSLSASSSLDCSCACGEECKFYLHFYKDHGRWFLRMNDRTSVSVLEQCPGCCRWPVISSHQRFLKFYINQYMLALNLNISEVKPAVLLKELVERGFDLSHRQNFSRAFRELKNEA